MHVLHTALLRYPTVNFLVFCSNKQRLWLIDFCHVVLTKFKCISIVQWYNSVIHIWSKHGERWCDRRREKHCLFSLQWMNMTIQTRSLKLKSDDFQSYPKRNIAAKDEKGVDDARKYKYFVNCSFSSFKNKICVLIKL